MVDLIYYEHLYVTERRFTYDFDFHMWIFDFELL